MSSDLFHSPDIDLQFLSDTFFPFPDLSLEILQTISNDPNQDQPQLSNPSPPIYLSTPNPLLPSSPPIQRMHNLSLNPVTSAQATAEGIAEMEKARLIQRSLSSQSLNGKPTFLFQPHFSSLLESPKIQTQMSNFAESRKFEGPMRRASSTGDLQKINCMQSNYGFSSPLGSENSSYMDEAAAAFRVGRYSAEERKQRIHRYRSKRNQRNFNKTIKYACRKTLADSRPRVRGRFARNDETGDIPKANGSHREEDDEVELWVDGLHEEDELMAVRCFANGMSPQFQCLGF